jgi:hypothetical protein
MSVYVDTPMDWGWKYGKSCHLIADTEEELHKFAAKIGMRRSWFQNKKDFPHYDLTVKRRATAVKLGAIEITDKELIKKIRK